MGKTFVIDANIVLRLFIDDGSDQHLVMKRLVDKLQQGQFEFYLEIPVAMEICFVLNKYYGLDRRQIKQVLSDFVSAKGVKSEKEILLEVLHNYSEKNVDFVDAYLAAKSRTSKHYVLTWDGDFKKLNCEHYSPNEIAF